MIIRIPGQRMKEYLAGDLPQDPKKCDWDHEWFEDDAHTKGFRDSHYKCPICSMDPDRRMALSMERIEGLITTFLAAMMGMRDRVEEKTK